MLALAPCSAQEEEEAAFKAAIKAKLGAKTEGMTDLQYHELFVAADGVEALVEDVGRGALPSWSDARFTALTKAYSSGGDRVCYLGIGMAWEHI